MIQVFFKLFKIFLFSLFLLTLMFVFLSCGKQKKKKIVNLDKMERQALIVCTTAQVGDILTNITQGSVDLKVMFDSGTDPHTFYPKPSDTELLRKADLIFFNGLNLEDKLAKILEHNLKYKSYPASLAIHKTNLIVVSKNNKGTLYDPHIWFDIDIWEEVVVYFTDILIQYFPSQKVNYLNNSKSYIKKLATLASQFKIDIANIPMEKRYILTTHDAFSYFARFNGFKTKSLLGITTYEEASIKTINEIQQFIIDNDIDVLFSEHGVRDKGLILLKKSLALQGKPITISDQKLYSDAMGDNFPQNTYIGMYQYNMRVLVRSLGK